jgi:hypothetical protein
MILLHPFLLKAGKTALVLGKKEDALNISTDIKDYDASPEAASVDVLIASLKKGFKILFKTAVF